MSKKVQNQLERCLISPTFKIKGKHYRGKVRDTWLTDDGLMVLVASDRISSFDHVLKQAIPFKGQVLNQLAAWFFDQTKSIVPNHVLAVPDANVTIGRACKPFPVEFVMRGYLAGHAWRTYSAGGRELCGVAFSAGLKQNSRLPEPILTPTTKVSEGHDEDTTYNEIVDRGIIEKKTLDQLYKMAFDLFTAGSKIAKSRGLILVDTKYEFGQTADGKLIVIDEVHTPDSSRYFYGDSYKKLLADDKPQRQLSKEFVREWLMENGFSGRDGEIMPNLPDDFRMEVTNRYIELYEAITGLTFVPDYNENPAGRAEEAVTKWLTDYRKNK